MRIIASRPGERMTALIFLPDAPCATGEGLAPVQVSGPSGRGDKGSPQAKSVWFPPVSNSAVWRMLLDATIIARPFEKFNNLKDRSTPVEPTKRQKRTQAAADGSVPRPLFARL